MITRLNVDGYDLTYVKTGKVIKCVSRSCAWKHVSVHAVPNSVVHVGYKQAAKVFEKMVYNDKVNTVKEGGIYYFGMKLPKRPTRKRVRVSEGQLKLGI